MQVAGWVLQAAALDRGPLVVVQSLTTFSLVIALPLGVRLTDQHVGPRELLGAVGVIAGIVLFLAAGTPAGGTSNPSAAAWWNAGLVAVVIVGAVAALGRTRHGARARGAVRCCGRRRVRVASCGHEGVRRRARQRHRGSSYDLVDLRVDRLRAGGLRAPAIRPQDRGPRVRNGREQRLDARLQRALRDRDLRRVTHAGKCSARVRLDRSRRRSHRCAVSGTYRAGDADRRQEPGPTSPRSRISSLTDVCPRIASLRSISTFIPTTQGNYSDPSDSRTEYGLLNGRAATGLTNRRELHDLRRHFRDSALGRGPVDQRTPHPVARLTPPTAQIHIRRESVP